MQQMYKKTNAILVTTVQNDVCKYK